uniref:ATP-binding protein n=1 Tax=Desulfobacca sp. TaxID=2067990 RepID=UPI00404903D8
MILLFALTSAALVGLVASRLMLGEIKKRGLSQAVSLAARTADPLLAQDFLRLKDMVDEVKDSSDDIVYTFIQDSHGQVLSHTFLGGFPVDLLTANEVPAAATQHVVILLTEDERVYDFAVPVEVGTHRLGVVRVGLSQIKAQAAVSRLLHIIFGVSAGAALMAVLLGTLFADTVTRRLEELRQAAVNMVQGNLAGALGPESRRPCWEIKECQNAACPAYKDYYRRCWLLADTACPECQTGGYNQKIEACRECQVYQESAGDEIQTLADTFAYMAVSLREHIEGLQTAQRILARQQQLLQTMLDMTPDLVSLQDAHLVYQAVNRSFLDYFGFRAEQVIGRTDVDIFPPAVAAVSREEDLAIVRSGRPLSKEIVIRRRQQKHWFHLVKVPIVAEDRVVGLLLTARNITELKEYQEKLVQAVKMEELGKLAGGVAHEINTPLGIILGYAQMLLEDLPQDEESYEFIQIIEKQVKICRRIVADLLSFSRISEGRKELLDVNETIQEVVQLVEHIFNQSWVRIDLALAKNLPAIEGDREKLKQVWLNLLNNAFEAIGQEGVIWLRSSLCPGGRHILVSVADTGSGISPEHLGRIFDPFFSTKAPGVGTGLGLAVSYGIIQEHQGKIMAVSPRPAAYQQPEAAQGKPVGPGALFVVKLPLPGQEVAGDACEESVLDPDVVRSIARA